MEYSYVGALSGFALAAVLLACHLMKPMMQALKSHYRYFGLLVEIATEPLSTWLLFAYLGWLAYPMVQMAVIQSNQ